MPIFRESISGAFCRIFNLVFHYADLVAVDLTRTKYANQFCWVAVGVGRGRATSAVAVSGRWTADRRVPTHRPATGRLKPDKEGALR